MHTKLIAGGNSQQQEKIINRFTRQWLKSNWPKPHPDLLVIQPAGESITISQARELKSRLMLKPYSAPVKLAIILQAEKLTLPAQNALLKTLEEPPAHSLIILITNQPDLLLPTIISRCELIKLANSITTFTKIQITKQRALITELLSGRVGERLKLARQPASDRQQAIEAVQTHLHLWRQVMLEKPTSAAVYNLRFCQRALRQLDANVNPHLVLGNLFLQYATPEVVEKSPL